MNKSKKEKIIFVSAYFKPHVGGVENNLAKIEEGLRKVGWQTVVVTSNEIGKGYEELLDGKLKIYRLPTWFKISNTPINPFWYFYLKKIIKKEKPSLINAHAPVPFIADMAAFAAGKIPFVLTYQAGTMKKNKPFFDFLIFIYEKFLLTKTAFKAKRIICPSRFVVSSLLGRFEKKAVVITPGVDAQLFKPSIKEGEKNSVLFIAKSANMFEMKGYFYLRDAMQKLPDLVLKVIGEPVMEKANNVVFLGTKTATETAEEMRKCTMLVAPSLKDIESFGMVIIEAMSSKKPVIAAAGGGIPEVIRDGVDGLLVPPANSAALASAIKHVCEDSKFADFLANNGYKKVQSEFLWQRKIRQTDKVFRQVLCLENS